MRKGKTICLGLILIIATAVAYSYIIIQDDTEVEKATARIAAFNIQVFGKTKSQKDYVMAVLTEIVREFDIVLIQEIRDASEQTVPYFVDKINQMEGSKYNYIRSERLGRTSSKEAYAYIYKTETVQFIQNSAYVYNDINDVFEREPFIADFKIGKFDFVLVGIHIKPADAYNEIGNLTSVVLSIKETKLHEEDIIVMGDFNADGLYFDEDDDSNPFKALEFHWIITNDMATVTKTNHTYDRIVILDSTLNHEYNLNTAQVFYFDQVYGITNATFVSEISDHYPIYAEYKTNLVDDD